MTEEIPISQVNKELYGVLADKTLSFGCKIFIENTQTKESATFTLIDKAPQIRREEQWWNVVDCHAIPESHFTKIIGHEPTLNDVLLKLKELDENLCYSNEGAKTIGFIVDPKNDVSEFFDEIFVPYDLTKSFDNQLEETKRKLHALLFNNQER